MIRSLGYLGVRSPAHDAWRAFATEVLGAELAPDGPSGAVHVRIDEAPWRLAVRPDEVDALDYLGWEASAPLDAVSARLSAQGVAVTRHDLGDARPAGPVVSFVDPFGFRHEVVEPMRPGGPFTPGRPMGGFVTGEQGLGHVVLIVPDLDVALGFYVDVLGLRLSDAVESSLSLRFLHCPGRAARHHTLALAVVPGLVGVHHVMLEVAELDDVGRAFDLVRARSLPVAMDLGRHTNDLMTSFYVRTPSGFELEYGCGGVVVDDETWEVGSYDAASLWGHRPPASGMLAPGMIRPFATAGGPT